MKHHKIDICRGTASAMAFVASLTMFALTAQDATARGGRGGGGISRGGGGRSVSRGFSSGMGSVRHSSSSSFSRGTSRSQFSSGQRTVSRAPAGISRGLGASALHNLPHADAGGNRPGTGVGRPGVGRPGVGGPGVGKPGPGIRPGRPGHGGIGPGHGGIGPGPGGIGPGPGGIGPVHGGGGPGRPGPHRYPGTWHTTTDNTTVNNYLYANGTFYQETPDKASVPDAGLKAAENARSEAAVGAVSDEQRQTAATDPNAAKGGKPQEITEDPDPGTNYQVTAPPKGATVDHLPSDAVQKKIGDTKYFSYSGTWYQSFYSGSADVYKVVDKPTGA